MFIIAEDNFEQWVPGEWKYFYAKRAKIITISYWCYKETLQLLIVQIQS